VVFLGGTAPYAVEVAGSATREGCGVSLNTALTEVSNCDDKKPAAPWLDQAASINQVNRMLADLARRDPGFSERSWREEWLPPKQFKKHGENTEPETPDRRNPDAQNIPWSARFARIRKEAMQEVGEPSKGQAKWLLRLTFLFTASSLWSLEIAAHLWHHPIPVWIYLLTTIGLVLAYKIFAKRRGWFETHLSTRALAEAMRVQQYWNALEIRQSVSDHFLHTHRTDLSWVRRAVRGWNLLSGAHQDRTDAREALYMADRAAFVHDGWLRRAGLFFEERHEKFEFRHWLFHGASKIFLGLSLATLTLQLAAWHFPHGKADALAHRLHEWRVGVTAQPQKDQVGEPPHSDNKPVGEENAMPPHAPTGPYPPSHELLTLFFCLLVTSGALHAFDDRRGYHLYAQRYDWMSQVLRNALSLSNQALPGLANSGQAQDIPPPATERARYRQLIFDTGLAALHETAQWVLLHRDRPVEPGGH
jgi:hypothetical protein